MTSLADSLVSASSRKLTLRKRSDLSHRVQKYLGRTYYVLKDPVGLDYFRLREEEFFVLNQLDGNTSLDEIKERFEKKFSPRKISLHQLQWFIGQLHRSNLILSNIGGQGERLVERKDEKRRKELLGTFSNVLALRFKGIDPERLLNFLYPFFKWAYHPVGFGLCLLFALSALVLVMVQFDEFQTKLPAFHEFFQAKNAWILVVTLALTKVCHEFGHGLTCKHFGGECHEMGVMFLVLTPCLYCNVSDSWLLPNKWHRAAIGAAGMYVELIIASACTFIWWFSEPGLLNYLCLSTMFVCSVSTVIFNANPLLRYDGYYILSDILEIPNLWQKSRTVLHRTLGKLCLGLKFPPDPFLPDRRKFLFGLYAVTSSVYRWIVLLSILWFLHTVLEPYRLEILGQMLAAVSLFGLIVMPLYRVGKFFWVPGRTGQVKMIPATITLILLGVAIAGVLYFPIPRYVHTSLTLEPRNAERIYVRVPGQIEEVNVEIGQQIEPNTVLAELKNPEVGVEIEELRGTKELYELNLKNLQRMRFSDNTKNTLIPQTRETLRDVTNRLEKRQEDQQHLILKASRGGFILPPQQVKPKGKNSAELRAWEGTPLDEKNRSAYLETGTLFCMIGKPDELLANLVIDQSDIEFVQTGQKVEIKLDELPLKTFEGTISEVAKIDLKATPQQLSARVGGNLPTKTDPKTGAEVPLSTSYQAHVPLDDTEKEMLLEMSGRAKIHTGTETFGRWLYRYVSQVFNFS
ncbi:HlyD family efflux transporter periplasmic adaptor subunit [Planctomycetales bacterium 10988]|nr:HlyD family efflux transporter periplasmic adaptor subunit [Planctomycetales bacterium 10988]